MNIFQGRRWLVIDVSKVKVTHIMADGCVCEDIGAYLDTHLLPEDVQQMILGFIQDGHAIGEQNGLA